ncbi:MAG: HPr(Ser) kinase/phosphatase [Clostridia bacterium]
MTKINHSEVENDSKFKIKIANFCDDCNIQLLYGNANDDIEFSSVLVNRPGLLLTGFKDYFGNGRVQIIGNAEHYYYNTLNEQDRYLALERVFSQKIPCVIYARNIQPPQIVEELSKKYNIPVMLSDVTTTAINSRIADYLDNALAPTVQYHGTLLDIGGTGVLLTGNSGLGKSETALELIHLGHRLVADDAVIIKRVSNELVGRSPENIKFFMEVRGIGIIDVRSMYGVGSVLDSEDIHLAIQLEKWTNDMTFDRLGNNEITENILGIELPKLKIPVMPGRNLAALVEVAVRNYRLKNFGFDAVANLMEKTKLNK